MTTQGIDTLAISKRLQAVGYTQEQAEEQAKIQAEVIGQNAATKEQLTAVETKLTTKIDKVRTDLTTEIEKVKTELTTKIEKVETTLRGEIKDLKIELFKWIIPLIAGMYGLLIFVLLRIGV